MGEPRKPLPILGLRAFSLWIVPPLERYCPAAGTAFPRRRNGMAPLLER